MRQLGCLINNYQSQIHQNHEDIANYKMQLYRLENALLLEN